eukprot:scaffold499_cov335-Pavlova_lutheri.AAC.28
MAYRGLRKGAKRTGSCLECRPLTFTKLAGNHPHSVAHESLLWPFSLSASFRRHPLQSKREALIHPSLQPRVPSVHPPVSPLGFRFGKGGSNPIPLGHNFGTLPSSDPSGSISLSKGRTDPIETGWFGSRVPWTLIRTHLQPPFPFSSPIEDRSKGTKEGFESGWRPITEGETIGNPTRIDRKGNCISKDEDGTKVDRASAQRMVRKVDAWDGRAILGRKWTKCQGKEA